MKQKGTPKTGGRKKGTPNKTTLEMKNWVSTVLEKNKVKFEKDLKNVDPEKRLAIIEKLLQYVIPKQQSISIEAQIQAEYSELEKLLKKAPEDVIDTIIERIENLKKLENDQK